MEEEIERMIRRNLRDNFSLFKETDRINVHINNPRNICIGYRTSAERIDKLRGMTHFDIQIIDDICYILWIELEKSARGKGVGWSLYKSIHSFARDFGSKRVKQTPSGWTPFRKTRRDYLLERGYSTIGKNNTELELVLQP